MPEYTCQDISDLENQLAIYESELSDLQSDLTDLQTDLSTAESLLGQYKSNLEKQQELLFEKQLELANVQRELQTLRNELAFLELRLAELEREKADMQAYIQSQPEIKSLWCADYTTDLSGEVGLADVPGEMNAIQIRQGYEGRANYEASRDGILQHAKASSPANTWIQACLMPAVRKWNPQYRHGSITAIDYDADTCSIKLDEATGQYLGDVFDINTTYELHNVPIDYMECNADPFVLGDKILIEYPDRKVPKVIGFKEEPRPCGESVLPLLLLSADEHYIFYLENVTGEFTVGDDLSSVSTGIVYGKITKIDGDILYGLFTIINIGEQVTDGNGVGTIADRNGMHFSSVYDAYRITDGYELGQISTDQFGPFMAPTDLAGTLSDLYPPKTIQNWYKTFDYITISISEKLDTGQLFPTWGLSATYQGRRCTIAGNTHLDGYQRYYLGADLQSHKVAWGADIWKESDNYMLTIASCRNRTLQIFQLDINTLDFVLVESYGLTRPDDFDENTYNSESLRMIGAGEREAYWAFFGYHAYLKLTQSGTEMIEHGLEDDGKIINAAWNHATNEIGIFWRQNPSSSTYEDTCEITYGPIGVNRYGTTGTVFKNMETGDVWWSGPPGWEPPFVGDWSGSYYTTYCPEPIDLGWLTEPFDNWPTGLENIYTRYRITTALEGQSYYVGFLDMDGENIDLGRTENYAGYTVIHEMTETGGHRTQGYLPYSNYCDIYDAKEAELISILFDASGGFAGKYRTRDYEKDTIGGIQVCNILADEWNDPESFGSSEIAEIASSFPHDNFKALIKSGAGCDNVSVPVTVVYNDFSKSSSGTVNTDEYYSRDRVIFEVFDINDICG